MVHRCFTVGIRFHVPPLYYPADLVSVNQQSHPALRHMRLWSYFTFLFLNLARLKMSFFIEGKYMSIFDKEYLPHVLAKHPDLEGYSIIMMGVSLEELDDRQSILEQIDEKVAESSFPCVRDALEDVLFNTEYIVKCKPPKNHTFFRLEKEGEPAVLVLLDTSQIKIKPHKGV